MKGHKILILMGHWDILTKNLIYIMYTISFDFPGGSDLKSLPTMWETWIRSLGQKDPLEKEIATHSSILAWDIPWTEEPGGNPQSPWSCNRVGHDLVTKQQQ